MGTHFLIAILASLQGAVLMAVLQGCRRLVRDFCCFKLPTERGDLLGLQQLLLI